MACFIVPAVEAVVTTVAEKALKQHENPFSQKLSILNGMLWGGSGLLAFEHLWHGEITPFFPFLTNASNPADCAEMLHEMTTVGVGMAFTVTIAWGIAMLCLGKIKKSAREVMTE